MPVIKTERTLCFLLKGDKVYLSRKKTGQGVGNFNGYGGKLVPGETIEETGVREIFEESEVVSKKDDLEKRAIIEFYFPAREEWNQRVHVYILREWQGEPKETKEMAKPELFEMNSLPSNMWNSDKFWLPLVMQGKSIRATFYWKNDNKTVDNYKIEEVERL